VHRRDGTHDGREFLGGAHGDVESGATSKAAATRPRDVILARSPSSSFEGSLDDTSRFDLTVHVLPTVIADRREPAWDNPRDMIER